MKPKEITISEIHSFPGLRVSTFAQRSNPEGCTNGGASSTVDDFLLIGPEAANQQKENLDRILVLDIKHGLLRAVPLELWQSGTWVMFGGNFVYTSDSRFPSDQPIKVFDRVEGIDRPDLVKPEETPISKAELIERFNLTEALLVDAVNEIREFHATAYPDCKGGCPAHGILIRADKLLH